MSAAASIVIAPQIISAQDTSDRKSETRSTKSETNSKPNKPQTRRIQIPSPVPLVWNIVSVLFFIVLKLFRFRNSDLVFSLSVICFGCVFAYSRLLVRIRIFYFVTSVLLLLAVLFPEHRAAATPRAAETSMLALGFFRVPLSDLQVVIVAELLPDADIAARFDENSMAFFLDLAVGRAGVVDPARQVAAPRRIDH